MHIVDRRLNPRRQEPRQPPALSAPRQGAGSAGGARQARSERDIKDVEQGGEVAIPLDGVREPRFHRARAAACAITCCPATRSSSKATRSRGRRAAAAGRSEGSADGDGEDDFRFVLIARRIPRSVPRRPRTARSRQAARWRDARASGLQRAGYTVTGSPANLALPRTMRNSLARRIALRRPKPEELAGAARARSRALAGDEDDAERLLTARRARARSNGAARRIPYIDPIDLRYRRFEPRAEAGGAGGDVLPDGRVRLDDRAHEGSRQALLHAALHLPEAALPPRRDRLHPPHRTRPRRWTRRRSSTARRPAAPWSRPRSRRCSDIVAERYPAGGLEHLRRAGLRRRQFRATDSEHQRALLTTTILPVCQYFAYLEVGSEDGRLPTGFIAHKTTLWQHLYERCARAARRISRCARSATAARSIPVFHELFQRREREAGTDVMTAIEPSGCSSRAPTGTSARSSASTTRSRRSRVGRARARRLSQPDRGHHRRADARRLFLDRHAAVLQALVVRQALRPARGDLPQGAARAWPTRSSSTPNPCITYIMEENTATMQTLVIAHAAFGHNHFFKNNYLFKQWTDADGILDYLEFAKSYIAHCEERYGQAAVERMLDAAHALMATASTAIPRKKQPDLRSEERREQERRAARGAASTTTCGAPCRPRRREERRRRWTTSAAARCSSCRRKTSSISSRRRRRGCSPGSARSCASCATSRSISIRRARPR